jgi:hypothetical protein
MGIGQISDISRTNALLQRSRNNASTRAIKAFTDVVSAVANSARSGVTSALGGLSGGSSVGIDSSYQAVLETQMQFQQQMQLVSLESNRQRTDHDAKMTIIRNTRAG